MTPSDESNISREFYEQQPQSASKRHLHAVTSSGDKNNDNEGMEKNTGKDDNINMEGKNLHERLIEIFMGSIAISIAILAIIVAIGTWTIDKSVNSSKNEIKTEINSLKNDVNSKFDQINTKFEYFEKYSDQKIENEVNKARLGK